MAKVMKLSWLLWQDKRGEIAIYSLVFTITAAVMVGLVMFTSGLDSSFQSIGDLNGLVRAGL